jgi:tRNA dimethylallyltransferase
LLLSLDAQSAARIQARDTQKIIRAVEVCLLARQPFSSLLARGRVGLQGFRAIKIGLNPDRAELDRRINARVERMFAAGLVDEARALFEGTSFAAPSRQGPFGALGYPQAMSFVCGEISEQEAVRETQTLTRRYAKRQRTWFRREPDVTWFSGFGDDSTVQQQVVKWLASADFKSHIERRERISPAPAPSAIAP